MQQAEKKAVLAICDTSEEASADCYCPSTCDATEDALDELTAELEEIRAHLSELGEEEKNGPVVQKLLATVDSKVFTPTN